METGIIRKPQAKTFYFFSMITNMKTKFLILLKKKEEKIYFGRFFYTNLEKYFWLVVRGASNYSWNTEKVFS